LMEVLFFCLCLNCDSFDLNDYFDALFVDEFLFALCPDTHHSDEVQNTHTDTRHSDEGQNPPK
jgi:hypothetical protein